MVVPIALVTGYVAIFLERCFGNLGFSPHLFRGYWAWVVVEGGRGADENVNYNVAVVPGFNSVVTWIVFVGGFMFLVESCSG